MALTDYLTQFVGLQIMHDDVMTLTVKLYYVAGMSSRDEATFQLHPFTEFMMVL